MSGPDGGGVPLGAEREAEVVEARASHLPGCPARRRLDDLCRCRHLRGEVPTVAPDEVEASGDDGLKVEVVIPGPPVVKARARRDPRSGRWFTPERTRQAQAAVAWHARAARVRFAGPVDVELVFCESRPACDVDNLAKLVLDGLVDGGMLGDDRQVRALVARRARAGRGEERTNRPDLGDGFVMGTRRETVDAKARRYLAEGRVEIVRATDEAAYVRVQGAELYRVVRTEGAWTCTCPARAARCSHVIAAERATAPRRPLRQILSAEEISGLRREVSRRRLEESAAGLAHDRELFAREDDE